MRESSTNLEARVGLVLLHVLDHILEENVHLALLPNTEGNWQTSASDARRLSNQEQSRDSAYPEVDEEVLHKDLGDLDVLVRILHLGHDLCVPIAIDSGSPH